jgi:putative nucleotidyltransferase with HDIG domain
MLRPLRHEWEMSFAGSGDEALRILDSSPFDVVVTDMQMPGMNGAALLAEVRQRHPQVVRIILSGYSNLELICQSVGPAHQYLSKPSDAETIKMTVSRACALRDLLADDALQLLVSKLQSLPSLPTLYTELIAELQAPDPSIKKVGDIISRDLGMTPKILQMVNSAFFGIRRHISSPTEAVSLLGLDTIVTLAITVQIFSQLDQARVPGFSPDALYTHSQRVALFAKRIARAEGADSKIFNDAFTAGLLHDVGQLVLVANQPEQYTEVLRLAQIEQLPIDRAERQVFGATHAEVGAYLLGLWGLPTAIVEAVAFHHLPGLSMIQGFGALTAVHAGNVIALELQADQQERCRAVLDLDYLTGIGLPDRFPVWREVCAEVNEGLE